MVTDNLQHALSAYNSPNRDQYPLDGKTVSNLDAVEHFLRQAITQLPDHFGLPLTIANMETFRGNIPAALQVFQQCFRSTTDDNDKIIALTYLAVWHHYSQAVNDDIAKRNESIALLKKFNEKQAREVENLLHSIDAIMATPLCVNPNKNCGYFKSLRGNYVRGSYTRNNHAIVIMGYILNEDGSMADRLVQRLKVALKLARLLPDSQLIVTGGLAKKGTTESQQMLQWLAKNGISSDRIIEESKAINTIENARFSLDILHDKKVSNATIISGSNHVHRSQILFEILQSKTDRPSLRFNHCAVNDGLMTTLFPTDQTKLFCYIDALRAFGLPAFNCEPFIQV